MRQFLYEKNDLIVKTARVIARVMTWQNGKKLRWDCRECIPFCLSYECRSNTHTTMLIKRAFNFQYRNNISPTDYFRKSAVMAEISTASVCLSFSSSSLSESWDSTYSPAILVAADTGTPHDTWDICLDTWASTGHAFWSTAVTERLRDNAWFAG